MSRCDELDDFIYQQTHLLAGPEDAARYGSAISLSPSEPLLLDVSRRHWPDVGIWDGVEPINSKLGSPPIKAAGFLGEA